MTMDSELTYKNNTLWSDMLAEFYTVYVCNFMEPEEMNNICRKTTYVRTMNRGLTNKWHNLFLFLSSNES